MISSKFNWRQFLRNIAVIAIPVALQNLLTSTASMVDTMMISRLGETSVGAVGLCSQYAILMVAGYWGFVGGGMLFISQYWGASDEEGICRSYGLMLTCIMTVAAAFSSVALVKPELIMRLYTDKENIQAIGVQYLRIVGFAYPLQLYSICASTLLRATEKVKIPLYASVASVFTNIFMNWVLIYGHLGFKAYGVRGAAMATVCAAAVNVIIILVGSIAIKYPYLFRFKAHFTWVMDKVKEFFIKCFPIIMNEVFIGIGNMTVNVVLGRQSESAIAALAVFRTLEGLIIGFFAGFSNASSVLVGKEVGAGNLDDAYEKAKRIIPLCMLTIAFTGLLINIFKANIIHMMGLTGTSFDIASYIITVFTIVAVIRMGNWCMNDTYRSSGDAVTGTLLELIFMYIMVIPAVTFVGLKLKLSMYFLFPVVYCDEIVRWIIMFTHLFSGRWVRPVTEQGTAKLLEFRKKHGIKRRKSSKNSKDLISQ